jgi:signal transduction histidine kinase
MFATSARSSEGSTQKIDWAALIGPDDSWKWLHRGNQEKATPISVEVDDHFGSLVHACSRSNNRITSGMTRIGDQSLVMFAVVGLDKVDHQDQPQGRYLVACRTIDEPLVTALRRQTQVEFSLQSPRTSKASQKLVVWEANESTLVVEVQMTGVNDQKLANVYIRVPRDITARSSRTTALARNSFIFGSVAALLMLLLLLQRIVISPLTAIRQHSDRVAEEGLATDPLVLTRNDEIGQLATAFDKMVNRLSDTQTQLAKASRAAGRSQVASTVIHNVGNVLTNVNSLLDAASGRVHGLRIGSLDKLALRLRQDDSDDGLLAATPSYLEGLAAALESDQESIAQLLATLHDNICHIHDVIRDQQRHTSHSLKASRVPLGNVIDEAIACCRARLEQKHVSVEVSGQLAIEVHADRSLLLQTMINIIGNAQQAMRDNDRFSRMLGIHVEHHQHTARINFRDNGCGMTEDTIQKVFDAHFTTRESGTGLGLHFCAITLKRLGGSIHVTSDGSGCGSTFRVELPCAQRSSDDTPLVYNLSTIAQS